MSTIERVLGVGRFIGAALPFVIACYAGITYASQDRELEGRLAAIEITAARQDERWLAVVARIDTMKLDLKSEIDAMNTTLWRLIWATFGSTGISGLVAADRAMHKWRNSR